MKMDAGKYDMEVRKARVKARLDATIEELALAEDDGRRRGRHIWLYIAGALSAAALVVVAVLLNMPRLETQEEVNWTEVQTAYGEKKSVLLPDGTIIWLHNESRLLYPDKFIGRTRQVFSSGEVFAEVAKDSRHPFILSSSNVNVRVKGTVFNFRSYPGATEAELTLVEGAVDLNFTASGISRSVEVSPGQVVKADLENGKITRTFIAPEKYIPWTEGNVLYFNDETLKDIIMEMQRHFDIRIEVKDRRLLERRFYASFVNGESPTEILNSLNEDNIMQITRRDSTYYISYRR